MQRLTLTEDEIKAWLRLTGAAGLGPITVRRLLAAFGLPQQIFGQSYTALAHAVGEQHAQAVLHARDDHSHDAVHMRAVEWAFAPNHHFVTLADPAYPRALLEIADPPPVLYVRGRLAKLHMPALAVVGSRHASPQGLQNAAQFARALADAGLCIVSGLALGIDGAAHQGALEGRAGTVAVMGTGIDLVYPARHHALAQQIAASGAIVSEWALGAPARAAHFPQRNRLIAGLAQGALVIEAAAQSGSLITARLAAEAGREVFALPGSIHSPLSKGCHRLIKEGAKLVESIQDVLDELQPAQASLTAAALRPKYGPQHAALKTGAQIGMKKGAPDRSRQRLSATQQCVLEALGYDPCALETLMIRTGLESPVLQAALSELEIEGWVALLPGSRVARLSK
ncbi:putative DNA protecting protein DprA [Candidatus Glomeribacter gigasporarum BEG34]|uniref:Putative DNA protecting protein DprA n=1 Tax=Candidatus Glomeribacter gigasporarum BEG34 TaxID=1070319 RepID=G2J7I9_9BURK|nr:putative DNA protecting protein DprA [Candidatus Glomeribacter gigasporarum BEG34]